MLFGGGGSALLNLALHVPASATCPTDTEQLLLRAAGVSAIIVDTEAVVTTLPVVLSAAAEQELLVGGGAARGRRSWTMEQELLVDGTRWLWLRGDRKYVIDRAAGLSAERRRFIASLPSGRAASESAIRRSCILAWQLHDAGCSALVLPWPELEVAAATADSGWDGIAEQLVRMRRPEWTAIHGG